MSIELSDQQLQSACETPLRVTDPGSSRAFVLISADVYERLQSLLADDIDPRDAYPALDRSFAEGWSDPKMDAYDRYEEERERQQG